MLKNSPRISEQAISPNIKTTSLACIYVYSQQVLGLTPTLTAALLFSMNLNAVKLSIL